MIRTLRFSRPLYLLLAALTFGMGAVLAGYLGNPISLTAFWAGLLGVLALQAAMSLLAEVFRPLTDPLVQHETIGTRKALHDRMLYSSTAALSVFLVMVFLIFNSGNLPPLAILFFILELGLVLIYAVPPIRLVNRGFGEIILALHMGYLVPSLGFLLQAGGYHRLLAMLVFPLVLLGLACFLVLDFPAYSQDRKYNRGSMLVHIGWERAIPLHNILVASAYLILLAAPLFGISLSLIWPVFLTLPFALLQVISLRNISRGGKPIWLLLQATAIAIFGLGAYFVALTFWLR